MSQDQTPQEQQDKEQKKYEESMNKLLSIVGGKQNLRPTRRVKSSVVDKVVTELLKEDQEKAELEIKEGIKKLLAKNIEVEDEVRKKEKELEEVKKKKQKEFTEEANRIFQKIEDMKTLETRYAESLQKATGN
jgi:hypothetical protein